MDHYTLLFVSALAAGAKPDTVAGIARQARANNQRHDVTGLLVFDGQNFAQLMEGPRDAVLALTERMRSDTRHQEMEVLHSSPVLNQRRFPSWRMGYLVLNLQEFGIGSLRGQRGLAAMESFNFMLPALDLAIGDAIPAQLMGRQQ